MDVLAIQGKIKVWCCWKSGLITFSSGSDKNIGKHSCLIIVGKSWMEKSFFSKFFVFFCQVTLDLMSSWKTMQIFENVPTNVAIWKPGKWPRHHYYRQALFSKIMEKAIGDFNIIFECSSKRSSLSAVFFFLLFQWENVGIVTSLTSNQSYQSRLSMPDDFCFGNMKHFVANKTIVTWSFVDGW